MSVTSMTGFGRREGALGGWSWAVEARSVNGRNLETRFRGPPGMEALERAARDAAQARFQRGQVSVTVQARREGEARRTRVNAAALEAYLELCGRLAAEGRAALPAAEQLLSLPGVIETVEDDSDADEKARIEAAVILTLGEAFDGLAQARRAEGEGVGRVLSALVDRIENLTAAAEAEAAEQPAAIKIRFAARMNELLGQGAEPDRIAQEAAVMALKADVREELDRLQSHVGAARVLLTAGEPCGRKLDFLTQEFMREANTLCSKSASKALTALGLELKAAIDQFREQVQNVE